MLSPEKQKMNSMISHVRQGVEWSFGKIKRLWGFLDFQKAQRVRGSQISTWFKVGALLANCHTCLYGDQCGKYFQCDPPSLEEYLWS